MEKGYLNEVKAILKSLVLSCPDKMTMENLNRDFRDVEGENIPFRRLGYGNLELFLRSITDTVRVFGSGPTAMVCFVANEKSDHIHDMIMEQKKPSRRTRGSKSKSQGKNTNSGRNTNKFANNNQLRKMPGQQFSAFQSTNRSHMTKTLKVREIPLANPTASNYLNHRPPCLPSQMQYTGYQLPQPAGINLLNLAAALQNYPSNIQPNMVAKIDPNPTKNITKVLPQLPQPIKLVSTGKSSNNLPLNTVTKVETKSTTENNNISIEQKYQDHVKKLSTLMTSSCHITPSNSTSQIQTQLKSGTPPSSSPTQLRTVATTSSASLSKSVSFSPEIKTEEKIKSSSPSSNLNGIKPPKPKKKLSDDIQRLLNIPSRGSLNPIEEPSDLNMQDDQRKDEVCEVPVVSKNILKTMFDVSDEKEDDPDEAVPQFAANNLVYRLDFPDHTVGYGRKIPAYELDDDVHIGSYLRIFIAEIHNPFKFWFHIHKDEHELDLLMYQIERYYSQLTAEELRIPVACLTPGQTCAACYNDLWHRAEIVAPPVNNKIKVSFMDYGTVSEVDIKDIKFLASSFAILPAQALRGCLSHIKPRFLHWSHEATTYFLSLVSELLLYGKITEIDRKNQTVYMILCNTHGDEIVQINKTLVEKQYASYNEDWLDTKIKQNKGQRLHHPREDYPTFSMIESGEYPSFAEMVSLRERGIDYETIYDRIIFNKSAILNIHENAPEAIRKLPYYLMTTNPFRSDIIMELNGITAAAK